MRKKEIDKRKTEAIARMKRLGIHSLLLDAFKNRSLVYIHEPQLFVLSHPEEKDLERIRQFETKYNALVYLVIRNYTNSGTMDSMLFVSSSPEEWYMSWDGLADPAHWQQEAYVYNHNVPHFSEVGVIGLAVSPENALHIPHRIW